MMVLVLAWATASACAEGNAPPSLLWIPDQTVSIGQRLQVPLTAVDGDGDAVTFELSGLPEGAELAPIARSSALLMWSPTATDTAPGGQVYQATVRALDGQGGQVQQTFKVTVLPAYGVPLIELPPGLTLDLALEGDLTLEVTVHDDDSADVALSLVESPAGAQFLTTGPKAGLIHWKPEGGQLLELVHRFTVVASDSTNPPVSHTLMVVLLGASDELGCPGTAPTLIHTPLGDQEVSGGAVRLEALVQDQESQVQGVALYWTRQDPAAGVFQTLAFSPVPGQEGLFEVYLDPGPLDSGGSLVHYTIEATDNDDPTSEACDHHVVSPKERVHTVGLYPPLSGAACVDDNREPDDQLSEALVSGTGSFSGRMCGAQDDLYGVSLEGGETLSVFLSHTPEHGALKLDLLSADGDSLDHASANQGQLALDHKALASGPIFARVRSDDPSARLSYQLEITTQLTHCEPDGLEPNDGPGEASTVGLGVTEGLELCPADQDWHRVSITEAAQIEVWMRSEPGFGDLDLELLDGSGSSVLASSISPDPTEVISWTTQGAQDLLVRVYGHQGGVNAYELEVKSTPLGDACSEDLFGIHDTPSYSLALFSHVTYGGLTACSGIPDWYAIDLNGGEEVEVLVEPTSGGLLPIVTVYDQDITQITTGLGAPGEAALSASWVAPEPGRYHFVVTSDGASEYELRYTVNDPPGPCLTDRLEPNDSDASAVALEPGVHTWLRLCPDDPQDTFILELEPFDYLMILTSHLPGIGYTDLEVVDPSGVVIATALDPSVGPNLEVTVTEAGPHLLRVVPYSVTSSLGYDLAIWVD